MNWQQQRRGWFEAHHSGKTWSACTHLLRRMTHNLWSRSTEKRRRVCMFRFRRLPTPWACTWDRRTLTTSTSTIGPIASMFKPTSNSERQRRIWKSFMCAPTAGRWCRSIICSQFRKRPHRRWSATTTCFDRRKSMVRRHRVIVLGKPLRRWTNWRRSCRRESRTAGLDYRLRNCRRAGHLCCILGWEHWLSIWRFLHSTKALFCLSLCCWQFQWLCWER